MRQASASPPDTLLLDEPGARSLVLAQALEEGDPDGRLVGLVERAQVERDALAATGDPGEGARLDERSYLLERARRLLALLAHRQPPLAALQSRPAWARAAAWALPLLAFLAGAAVDRIDNPRQVNLLSPPLLAFLLWNLAVYVLLGAMAVAAFASRRVREMPMPWVERLASGWPSGARADIALRFQKAWWRVGGAVEGQRWRAILHGSAAAWAVGVAVSIVLGGLVREYRVGWESTLLELPQVHAFLRVLFAPVVALLPLEPFSQAELARLHFGSGADIGRAEARRWVFLYVGLLAIFVAVPRVLLAGWAALRARQLARRLPLALDSPYFREVLGRVRPAAIVLACTPAARERLAACLRQMAGGEPPAAGAWEVLRTERGDVLRLVPWPTAAAVPAATTRPWWAWRAPVPTLPQRPRADVLVVEQLEVARPSAEAPDAPAVLWVAGTEPADAALVRSFPGRLATLAAQALPSWREDERLWVQLQRLLPAYLAPGVERLRMHWKQQAQHRLAQSMRLLAQELLEDARDTQAVPAQPLGVRQLVVRGEREATHEARRQAQAALQDRCRSREAVTDARLRALYLLEGALPSHVPEAALPDRLRIAHAVHEPQAGLAGAAGGAAMGAAVDLATGGLTLGAASALGALIGGGAALAAAAWKNRGSDPQVSVVAFSDDVLQALAARALLRYLGTIHEGRGPADAQAWGEAIAAAIDREAATLRSVWERARSDADAADLPAPLASLLERMVLQVLQDLHGPASGDGRTA